MNHIVRPLHRVTTHSDVECPPSRTHFESGKVLIEATKRILKRADVAIHPGRFFVAGVPATHIAIFSVFKAELQVGIPGAFGVTATHHLGIAVVQVGEAPGVLLRRTKERPIGGEQVDGVAIKFVIAIVATVIRTVDGDFVARLAHCHVAEEALRLLGALATSLAMAIR